MKGKNRISQKGFTCELATYLHLSTIQPKYSYRFRLEAQKTSMRSPVCQWKLETETILIKRYCPSITGAWIWPESKKINNYICVLNFKFFFRMNLPGDKCKCVQYLIFVLNFHRFLPLVVSNWSRWICLKQTQHCRTCTKHWPMPIEVQLCRKTWND